MKRFLRTTSEVFETVDKNLYLNSIVFIEDKLQIWSNGKYYAANIDWENVLNNPIKTDGDGNKFLSNDGTYKNIAIPVQKTKLSEFENDCNFVSLETVKLMIQEALASLDMTIDPDVPEEPDVPEPDTPLDSVGSITENNSIIIDETQLENGIYTLIYIDSNNNIIDNFNEITSFEINN